MLAALAWAGGTACVTLLLAGNAVSRATAFASMDDEFPLDANTRRLFEDASALRSSSAASPRGSGPQRLRRRQPRAYGGLIDVVRPRPPSSPGSAAPSGRRPA